MKLIKKIFVKALLLVISLTVTQVVYAQTIGEQVNPSEGTSSSTPVRIIEPKKDIEVAKSAAIDDERFELGIHVGFLSVEDFNTNPSYGLTFTYHIAPRLIAQLNYGDSDVDRASFEDLNENVTFLRDEDRNFEYYQLLAGYRLFRGRSFLGANSKYNSDIYLLGGLGEVDFAGEENTSLVLGSSYRVVLTDALVASVDFRVHAVDRDFQNDSKQTLNSEFAFSLNVLF